MAKGSSSKGKGGGLLRTAERLGVSRGVFGGRKGWFYVGSGLWTLRTMRRMAERKSQILISEELAPGQRLLIANGRATIEEVDERGADIRDPQRHEKLSRKQAKAEAVRAKKAAVEAKKPS